MKNAIRWAALAAVSLTLCSCGIFSAEQVQAAMDIIDQMESQNTVTAAQADALREALLTNTGEAWYMQAGRIVLEVGMAVLGVRVWRGPSATLAERVARRATPAKS